MDNQEARKLLESFEWEEGKAISLLEGPYRYRIIVQCSSSGREEAQFANGSGRYFCYIEIMAPDGQWVKKGSGIVPILPDGRIIMVVEQRPPQGRYPDRPMIAKINGRDVDLSRFGPCSSLEFPGGAIDPGEGLRSGFLRELVEETGVENQIATFYSRVYPYYPLGSDLALQQYVGVIFLSGLFYEEHAENDGGLHIFVLTEEEVTYNIQAGVIHSVQAAILPWGFYKEIADAKKNAILGRLERMGYVTEDTVRISR